jgi:2'-5' RNA ligase
VSYAIELMLDPASEAIVRQAWASFAAAGLGDDMGKLGVHPHIALAVWDEAVPEQHEVVQAWAESTTSININLHAIGNWQETGVVYLAATPTAALLEMHGQLIEYLGPTGISVWDYYRPGRWIPHCTLAQGLNNRQIPQAIEHCKALSLPISAILDKAAMVSFRPVEILHTWPLPESNVNS